MRPSTQITIGRPLLFVALWLASPLTAWAESDASAFRPPEQVQVCQPGLVGVAFGTEEEPGRVRFDLARHLATDATVHSIDLRVDLSTMLAAEMRARGPLWRWADQSDWRPFWSRSALNCRPDAATGDCPEGQRLIIHGGAHGGPRPADAWTLELADPTGQVADLGVPHACVTIHYWPAGEAPPYLDMGSPTLLPDFGFGREPDAGPGGPPSDASIYAPPPPGHPDSQAENGRSPLPARTEERSGCTATPATHAAPFGWAVALLALATRRRRR